MKSPAGQRPLASGARGALPMGGGVCWGVTAGKANHSASNARDVTAGKMRRNSSADNDRNDTIKRHDELELLVIIVFDNFIFSVSGLQ